MPATEYSGSSEPELGGFGQNIAGGNAFPDGFWTMVGNDTDASIFVDNRDSVEGLRSIRIHTPVDHRGLMLLAFPLEVATYYATPGLKAGKKWTLSVWARAPAGITSEHKAPTLRFGAPYYDFYSWQTTEGVNGDHKPCTQGKPGQCEVKDVVLTSVWTKYELIVTSPDPLWHSAGTSWVFLEVVTAGVALVDLLELVPV